MNLDTVLGQRARVEEFQRKHRIGLLTLLFTDMVASTQLKQELGDHEAIRLIQKHHGLVRKTLEDFKDAEEIGTAGDSFFIVFAKPSEAIRFALSLQGRLRTSARETTHAILDRIGVHIGEVTIEERDAGSQKDLYGLQVDICARIMSLSKGNQILMSRSVFDSARQVLRSRDLTGIPEVTWLNHGPYSLKGVEEPIEICEVGETGWAVLSPPGDSEKVRRVVSKDAETVLGWRPAVGQAVPETQWVLKDKLGEGGFGEVWLGEHQTLKEQLVFKFCFRSDRVRSLRREVTLFRILREKAGDHPRIVGIREVYFEKPPYYLIMDYAAGKNLPAWCESQGGVDKVPLKVRLEIIAQVADGLQAAHAAGVIHRDVKPSNIMVSGSAADLKSIQVKLTDFGIGQVISEENLAGVTRAGFTQTMLASGTSTASGSLNYMAPEVMTGKPASTRADIYALGVVAYQFLLGDFTRPLSHEWADAVPSPVLQKDLKKCLAGNPLQRWDSVAELASGFRDFEKRKDAWEQEQIALKMIEEIRVSLMHQSKQELGLEVAKASLSAVIAAAFLLAGFVCLWAAYLVPGLVRFRFETQGNVCRLNLSHLNRPNSQPEMAFQKPVNLHNPLHCPSGGIYTKGADGVFACSIRTHNENYSPEMYRAENRLSLDELILFYVVSLAVIGGIILVLFSPLYFLWRRASSTRAGY